MGYKQDLIEKYYSTHLSKVRSYNKNAFKTLDKYYSRFLPKDKNSVILDLGCGYGEFISYLHSKGFSNASGIDANQEQVSLAKEIGVSGVKFGDILEWKGNNEDLIVMKDVLFCFTKDEVLKIIKNCYSSLLEGGTLLIKTANAEAPMFARLSLGDFAMETLFTATTLKQILRVCGFSKIDVFTMPPPVYGVKSFCRFVLWKIFEAFFRFYYLVVHGNAEGYFTQCITVKAIK